MGALEHEVLNRSIHPAIRRLQNERGAVLATVAIVMVGLCGMAGLALDSGRAYIARAELSRAVDAAALGGAAALRLGQGTARQRIRSLAAANGVVPNDAGVSLNLEFGTNDDGENTVTVSAARRVPTTFMRVLGQDHVDVSSVAQATVPPLDIVLVLDQSGSLASANAWDDLQRAARDFVNHFDDSIDQMGLISFQIRATDRFALDQPFRSTIRSKINSISSAGDTNTGEGLRLARLQLEGPAVRPRSVRVVVFFTDGRPTALRTNVQAEDRMIAVYTTKASGRIRGYFNNPDGLPTDAAASPSGCENKTFCAPDWNEPLIRSRARQSGIDRAAEIRDEGIYLFTIGLGDPSESDPLLQPDNDYLTYLANEDGVADPSQPRGSYRFAPSPAELDAVFDAVAQDILVRLTQ